MFLLGTVVNALAIIVGSVVGLVLPKIPDRMKSTIMSGVALCVVLIGLNMALKDMGDILILIVSIALGSLIGESINIENGLLRLGQWLERKILKIYQGPIAEAFVSASLLMCVGSMAVVGAIQDGTEQLHQTLFAKSILDLISAVVFTSTLGFGVALAAVPVFLYEGSIAVVSHFAGNVLNAPAEITAMTAAGGVLLIAMGMNLYGARKVPAGNMLPALILAPTVKWLAPYVSHFVTHLLR